MDFKTEVTCQERTTTDAMNLRISVYVTAARGLYGLAPADRDTRRVTWKTCANVSNETCIQQKKIDQIDQICWNLSTSIMSKMGSAYTIVLKFQNHNQCDTLCNIPQFAASRRTAPPSALITMMATRCLRKFAAFSESGRHTRQITCDYGYISTCIVRNRSKES